MPENNGVNIIQSLRSKWVRNAVLSFVLIAAACAFICGAILYKISVPFFIWALITGVIVFIALLIIKRPWQTQNADVARYLNTAYPALEESCGLLLKQTGGLNLLETLQAEKTMAALQQIAQPSFIKPLRVSALALTLSCIAGLALAIIPFNFNSSTNSIGKSNPTNTVAEKILPAIQSAEVNITPPAYTKLPARQQHQFNLKVEEGSTVQWQVQTTAPVKTIKLLFNDSTSLLLTAGNNGHTQWHISKKITASGFYQVMIDSMLSEFYKIESIKDQPPVIVISSPKPNISIEYFEPQRVNIAASVTDDYGIKNATVIATIASGSGEAVKFKEQEIKFANSFNGEAPQYQLQKMIDLAAMGMQPADELYFYIKATDNNNQEKRSDIYIVTLADTAQLMESDVLIGNVKLKPEYFRSERQIIIETEQLLKDKDTIAVQDFKNRSNNLGIDQKLLRLRYGKFLGDENESNEAGNDNSSALSDPTNFGKASTILDAFSDKHDNAEDATFFTDEIKQQLKATLTEMWNAEIQLRTFKPLDALPYEYKALRLLKDLQQKSRVYVAKTSFKTTPLKPEKRLTADLSKIIQPQTQANIPKNTGAEYTVANSLALLEQLKVSGHTTNDGLQLLQQAMQLLSNKAAANPATYLQGLQSLKKMAEALQSNKPLLNPDIEITENALQKIITAPAQLPQKAGSLPGNQLQQQYFKNLQKSTHG